MNTKQLKEKLTALSKEELIHIITEVHEDLGCVRPFFDSSNVLFYPRIAPFSYGRFPHGISQANTFGTNKECKEFCTKVADYLKVTVEYHVEDGLLS